MTPERRQQADRASAAFQVALAQLGASTVQDALVLWDEVPAGSRPAVAARWLRAATRLVMTRRRAASEMAVAYYRYVRALHTGTTIPSPSAPEQTSTTLPELRQEFEAATGAQSEQTPEPDAPEPEPSEDAPEPEPSADDEADRILIEEIEALEEESRRVEAAAEEEARIALAALGAVNQQKQLDAEVDPDEAHLKAGARQAAAAERIAMNGARSELWSTSEKDQRVLGYVRVSRTGTPCGWCAMLISRGPVYRSEKSATYGGGAAAYDDGDKYHDNCNCYAMPVFSREQFSSDPLYALNRQYAEEWPRVTRGLSGKAAVSAWRYYIRQQAKSAQEA